ncbi:MAG: hypothetical protein AAB605_01485 [Patescibacteria group bacterium]
METVLPFLVIGGVAFVSHLFWERAHIYLYTNYEKMKGALPVFILATLGDVLYTFLALVLVAFFKGSIMWFLSASVSDYVGLAVLGFCIAVFVEYKAMALEQWEYTLAMPRIFGLGLTPLLQMTVLLPLSVYFSVAVINWF